MDAPGDEILFPKSRVTLGWIALFLLLVVGIFNSPIYPSIGLDSSWRMALGYFYEHHLQFGPEVLFSYGPLGFEMGKTYSGIQFTSLIVAQLGVAVFAAWLIIRQGRRLTGLSRWAYFLCFFLFGITYEDALQMLVIALAGFELFRTDRTQFVTIVLLLALAVMSAIKFTNFLLAGLAVAAAVALALSRRRPREALLLAGVFGAGFVATWTFAGQSPFNIPNYLHGSWLLSQGYGEIMGLVTPWPPLWRAFVVLGVLGAYLVLHFVLNPDKPRALANIVLAASYLFVNWKHGFVRSDGHMIGFFFCALLPMTAYPNLLDDPPRLRRLHYAAFVITGLLAISGIENSLYHTAKAACSVLEEKIWGNLDRLLSPAQTWQVYHDKLLLVREAGHLPLVEKAVGHASIDVLGWEQAVALFNDFNYRPRPAVQSYATYNQFMVGLDRAYYESDHAPEYVLVKIQAIDNRLPMMDDSAVWRMLPYRYDYVMTEKGFQLWKRQPGPFDPAKAAPHPLLKKSLPLGETLSLEPYKGKELWVRITLPQTLLGRLHAFLYKPPHVNLGFKDDVGTEGQWYLPLPLGDAGFILNPVIEDTVGFASFANGRPGREVRSIQLKVKPGDRLLYADAAEVEIGELTPAGTGEAFFKQINEVRFHMFKSFPIQYEAHVPISENTVDGKQMMVLHAPSEMTFVIPPNAHKVSGWLGFVPGAYENGGDTNGAEFVIYWSNGTDSQEIYRRMLDPVHRVGDRGMQEFAATFDAPRNARLYLRVEPGPYGNFAWDWTGWSGIEIK